MPPKPLFSASAPEVRDQAPEPTKQPTSFVAWLRRFLVDEGQPLFRAESDGS